LPPLTHIQHGDSLVTPKFDYHTAFDDVFAAGGFDVVVGNPPYVRQETLGAEFKDYVAGHYTVYAGTADLYVYFIERGLTLLKQGGALGYILPNKWMRANYGKQLRHWMKSYAIQQIIDFGELPVFPEASTFPSILTVNKTDPTPTLQTAKVQTLDFASLDEHLKDQFYDVNHDSLVDSGWSLAKNTAQHILDKMQLAGTPLGEYVNKQIYYGIKTGYNEAFVIDEATHRALIAQDPNSADVIKPFLAGRDIKRYETPHAEKYLISLPNGWTRAQMAVDLTPLPPLQSGEGEKAVLPTSESPLSSLERGFKGEVDAWAWLSSRYPAIANHLMPFTERAQKRGDKGEFWWELRPCGYYSEFDKPKIIYPDIAKNHRMSYDTNNVYLTNTCYFIPTDDLALLGILNSSMVFFYYKNIASVLGDADKGGRLRWFYQDVSRIPIPTATDDQRATLIGWVEKQLAYHAESATLEKTASDRRFELSEKIAKADSAIDDLVAGLYGIDEADVALLG